MAAIILGNVKVQGVNFASGDVDNYVLTSTGAGDYIKGEGNLTFDGSTLVLTGATTISGNASIGGTVTATGLSSASTTSVVNYNTTSGLLSYNTSGGSATTYLDGTGSWTTPAGTGGDVTISTGDTEGYYMYSTGTGDEIRGNSVLQYNDTYGYVSLSSRTGRDALGSPGTEAGTTSDPAFVRYGSETASATAYADDTEIESGTSITFNAYRAHTYVGGSYTTVTSLRGFSNEPYLNTGGVVSNTVGIYHEPYLVSGTATTSSIGLQFVENGGSGTLVNAIGMKVPTLTNGSSINTALLVGDSDADQTIVQVGVTGDPKFEWDESETEFTLTEGLNVDGDVTADTLVLEAVPTYADNTAAKAGGLTDNDIYRTSTGILMVVYT